MEKIYGNKQLLATIGNMISSDRAGHTIMFYGEYGLGKKHMAEYYTASLLCENPVDGTPCGVCRTCLNVARNNHPDVMYVPTSGKLGGYSAETARAVVSDASIKPNNSTGKKVYIFRDCRDISAVTQNILLKIIEEPPDYAYFIFTAESKTNFLPTIISRCLCFGMSVCSEEETVEALRSRNCSEAEIASAVKCFHGNVGQCLDYLRNDSLKKIVDLTKTLTDSIIRKDEYALNVTLFNLGKERSDVKNTLIQLDKLVRDCAVLARDKNSATIGCWYDGAVALSEMLTVHQASRLHSCIERAWNKIGANVSIPLALASMAGEIMNCL